MEEEAWGRGFQGFENGSSNQGTFGAGEGKQPPLLGLRSLNEVFWTFHLVCCGRSYNESGPIFFGICKTLLSFKTRFVGFEVFFDERITTFGVVRPMVFDWYPNFEDRNHHKSSKIICGLMGFNSSFMFVASFDDVSHGFKVADCR